QVDPHLGTCSLTELRQRQSSKWREYPPDVLPAFVAEMDFSLAEPIITAVASALALRACGCAHPGQRADAFAPVAADRPGGAPRGGGRVRPWCRGGAGARGGSPSPPPGGGGGGGPPRGWPRRSGSGSATTGGGSSTPRWPAMPTAATPWTRMPSRPP